MLSDLNCGQFTIINQIPKSQAITTKIRWIKHTLVNCDKKDGLYDKSSGQILYRVNTFTAYVYDWQRYKKPLWDKDGYYALPDAEKSGYYTVNVGDLIIFAEIPDSAPTTTQEFNAIREKYKGCGGMITGAEVYINYNPNGEPWKTNHIEIIKE